MNKALLTSAADVVDRPPLAVQREEQKKLTPHGPDNISDPKAAGSGASRPGHRSRQPDDSVSDIGFYSPRQTRAVTTLSDMAIWRLRQTGDFPNPVKLTKQRVGYPKAAVNQWIAARLEKANQQQEKKHAEMAATASATAA
jgi:predicted DNA-binding transcriptional regulator AlpA